MSLKINTREVGGVTVLDLDGRLMLGDAAQTLSSQIAELVQDQKSRIVLNLQKLTFIDSSGVGTLVRSLNVAKQAGGGLKLAQPTDHFREILKLTRLETVLDVYDTEEKAVASLG